MRKLLSLLPVLLIVVGCGNTEYVTTNKPKAQAFEGLYYCENNGNIELVTDYNNSVLIETYGQVLNTINPVNGTLGTFQRISLRDIVINGNKLVIFPRNYTYSSSTQDLENDVTGANITGSKRTDINILSIDDNTITINVKIYSNPMNTNINAIVLDRTTTCKK